MLCATWIIAAASIAAALAACLSARTVSREMRRQNESLEKQLNAYKLALSVDIMQKFDAHFNEPSFRGTRSNAAKALLSRTYEEEAEDIFDFFDTVGLFVKFEALSDELAYSVFFHWINLYWTAGKHHIGSKQTETSTVWNNFRTLSERVRGIERQKDPESEDLKMPEGRLRAQLQEEIDLPAT
jgi:hypothetical protein